MNRNEDNVKTYESDRIVHNEERKKTSLQHGNETEHAFIAGLIKGYEKLVSDKTVEGLINYLLDCNLTQDRYYGKTRGNQNGHFVFMNKEYSLFVNVGGKIQFVPISYIVEKKRSNTPKRVQSSDEHKPFNLKTIDCDHGINCRGLNNGKCPYNHPCQQFSPLVRRENNAHQVVYKIVEDPDVVVHIDKTLQSSFVQRNH